MTRDQTTPDVHSSSEQWTAAIKSPRPQRPLRWNPAPPPSSLAGAAGREMSPAFLASQDDSNGRKESEKSETGFNSSRRSSAAPHVERDDLERTGETGIQLETELLSPNDTPDTKSKHNRSNFEITSSVHGLMKQSMARRTDFEKPSAFQVPFVPFSQQLPTPDETPLQAPRQPGKSFVTPRRSATPFARGTEQMTPSPSPEGSEDEDEIAVELELSVGRLGLGRKSVNGGNSPANERVDDEEEAGMDAELEIGEERGHELSSEDLAVLERAATILRGQVRHFEKEINANINHQVRELYKDSFDPPDIADMDSMPDFHLRNNPHAPNAIVKTVQVCCAVERGLAAILEVQRGDEVKGRREESLMEICVKRPVVTGKEMQSAVKGIAKTVGYGGREKRGSSVEWKK